MSTKVFSTWRSSMVSTEKYAVKASSLTSASSSLAIDAGMLDAADLLEYMKCSLTYTEE
jgi:hypothetical protein